MANQFGEWHGSIVLPGADAVAVVPKEQDRRAFDAGDSVLSQITHHLKSDLIHSPVNPVVGNGADISVVGMSGTPTDTVAAEVSFGAIPAKYSSSSSSSSLSSDSSSSLSSSSNSSGSRNWLYAPCVN